MNCEGDAPDLPAECGRNMQQSIADVALFLLRVPHV